MGIGINQALRCGEELEPKLQCEPLPHWRVKMPGAGDYAGCELVSQSEHALDAELLFDRSAARQYRPGHAGPYRSTFGAFFPHANQFLMNEVR